MSAEPFSCLHIFLTSQAQEQTVPLLITVPCVKLNVCDVNDVCGHVKSACFCFLQNVSVCLDHVLNIFLSFLGIVP